MNVPYALQLAHGWTKLALSQNVISLVLLAPLLFWATIHYGPVGAASIWIILNAGYVAIGIQVMHRRLLPLEKAKWYCNDVAFPLIGTLTVAAIARFLLPNSASPLMTGGWLLITLLLAMAAAALATSYPSAWIKNILFRRQTEILIQKGM